MRHELLDDLKLLEGCVIVETWLAWSAAEPQQPKIPRYIVNIEPYFERSVECWNPDCSKKATGDSLSNFVALVVTAENKRAAVGERISVRCICDDCLCLLAARAKEGATRFAFNHRTTLIAHKYR